MNTEAIMSSDSTDWNTPEEVLELIRGFSRIGLDPCANATSKVGAREEWRLEKDGNSLCRPWHNRGLVFCNPPYGRHLLTWARKICAENAGGAETITLVPARTDTKWWEQLIFNASAVAFWRGRVSFDGAAAGPAPFPSALVYSGKRTEEFALELAPSCWVVRV